MRINVMRLHVTICKWNNKSFKMNNAKFSVFLYISVTLFAFIRRSRAIEEEEELIEDPIDLQPELNYAFHPLKLTKLALLEEDLANILWEAQSYIPAIKTHPCHFYREQYLSNYVEDAQVTEQIGKDKWNESDLKAQAVAENPILAYKTLQRLSVDFPQVAKWCEDIAPDLETLINATVIKFNVSLPTMDDLDDATLGILRIHYVYGLHASDIQKGIFKHVATNATLKFRDCIELANTAIELEGEVLAYQWIQAATAVLSTTPLSKRKRHDIENTEILEDTWNNLIELTGNEMSKMQHHLVLCCVHQDSFDEAEFDEYQYYRNCRGEKYEAYHHCTYETLDWDPYYTINPLRFEVISRDPKIAMFHDIFGEKTIKYLEEQTQSRLARSRVQKDGDCRGQYVGRRTSVGTVMPDKVDRPDIIQNIKKNLEKMSGMVVAKENASEFQVVQYSSLGGHYDPHYDIITDPDHAAVAGNRIGTFLMFLSDVKMGGYTTFPSANVFVKPKKGSAIFWFNYFPNYELDDMTYHGGCPVILGQKFVANIWVSEFANFKAYPCVDDYYGYDD